MRNCLIKRWALGFGIVVILLSPNLVDAQRPSLGGLQLQINDMLSGELDFEVVSFGDDCRFCIDPQFPGLTEKDPGGFRLFGDPNSQVGDGAVLRFGPTDDCSIGIAPLVQPGLILRDPNCFIFQNPLPLPPKIVLGGGILEFGPECRLRVDPTGQLTGMIEEDPFGLRLLGQGGQGCILTFGPTDLCRIRVAPNGPTGLIEEDRVGVRLLGIQSRLGPREGARLLFGPTDDCTFGLDPTEAIPGLLLRDPSGMVLQNIGSSGQDGVRLEDGLRGQLRVSNIGSSGKDGVSIVFGPTDDCSIGIDPNFIGMTEKDPNGLRLLGDPRSPVGEGAVLRFGPTDDCSLGIDPNLTGLVERDPGGLRLLGNGDQGCILSFGPTDDCRILVDPANPGLCLTDRIRVKFITPDVNVRDRVSFGGGDCSIGIVPGLTGLVEQDPGGLRLLGPNGTGCILTFGPTDLCRIFVDPIDPGLRVSDPTQVLFENPLQPRNAFVRVDGELSAIVVSQTSSRDLKENVRTIDNALDKVKNLRGVYFDWKEEFKAVKDGESRSAVGFIAEEVAEVVPEVVKFDETGKKAEGVQYANLVSLVVESVKEQQQQIEAQQQQIDNQQAQIDEQQQVIQELQAAVAQLMAQQR